MKSSNRVAVALGLQDTATTIEMLNTLRDYIGLAEVRLDMMDEFDLQRIITAAPCPLVVTCRPIREGGSYVGNERDRLAILTRASELNCAYVDVEWDSVDSFSNKGRSTKVIVSRHYYDSIVEDAWTQYKQLRTQADAVKLVGYADQARDALPTLDLIAKADSPVIAIAMGPAGLVTRLLSPCFDACLLTYGAISRDLNTAPGQISVQEMVDKYTLDQVSATTKIKIYLYSSKTEEAAIQSACGGDGESLHLAMQVQTDELRAMAKKLRALSPRITAEPFDPS